ncbi:MAG: c-type cytochrome, partial [Myxococcales bacterium]|nr:c-type cytochrome [Myxococcales bacterium]
GGEDGANLSKVGSKSPLALDFTNVDGPKTAEGWHRAHLRDPSSVSPGSVMPAHRLDEPDEDALITYILSLRESPVPMELMPKHSVLAQLEERRDYPSQDGSALFRMFCSACHGRDGEGQVMPSLGSTVPSITNPDLLAIMSEGQIRRTLALGRPGRHMPAWGTKEAGLTAEEVDQVVAWIGGHRPTPPPFEEVAAAEASLSLGESTFAHDCSGCHGGAGEGTVIAPSLVNAELLYAASDQFFYETIARGRADTAMPSFAHYDASTMASVLAWLRSHEPEEEGWRSALDDRVLPRLFVTKLHDYRARGSAAHGAVIFKQTCSGCHGDRGEGAVAPAIANAAFLGRATDGFIAASIILGRGQRAMRSFDEQGLARTTEREVGDLIAFLRKQASSQGFTRLDTRVRANGERGKELFAALCAGCHGDAGEGRTAPALHNQGLLDAVTDGFLQATIARGRRGTAMRGWAVGGFGFAELSPEEINDIVAFIRSWDDNAPAQGGS